MMLPRILTALAMLVWWLGGFGSNVAASDAVQDRNCVDTCILEFAQQVGHPITQDDLDSAVAHSGLQRMAIYRSLAQCQSLLNSLGIAVRAVPFAINPQTRYPSLCILFVPPKDANTLGHVVVVSSENGTDLRVFDPAARVPVGYTVSAKIPLTADTIALVPAGNTVASAVLTSSKVLGPGFLIGVLAAWAYWWLYRKRKHGGLAAASSAVIVLGWFSTGCNHPTAPAADSASDSPIVVDSPVYDVGVVKPGLDSGVPGSSRIHHTFCITNRGSESVIISGVSSSCACAVANKMSQDVKLAAGSSMNLPVTVRLDAKIGAFQEDFRVRFKPETIPVNTLSIKGFVRRDPQPALPRIRLSALPGREAFRDTEIFYVRLPSEEPSEIAEARIEATDGVATRFSMTTPQRENGITQAGPADAWRFRVTYRQSPEPGTAAAKIRVRWLRPEAETVVELEGFSLPPLEIVGEHHILTPRLSVGAPYTENIPIRVYDADEACRVLVKSKKQPGAESPGSIPNGGADVQIAGEINVRKRRLQLSVLCVKPGVFRQAIQLYHGKSAIAELEVAGVAN
jgi:Protein of unknown function (DUF1573)